MLVNSENRLSHLILESAILSSSVVWDRAQDGVVIVDHGLVNYTPVLKLIGPVHLVHTDGDILPVLQGLDRIQPGHVLVIQDERGEAALLGDIVMLAAKQKGVAGIVCTGLVRDIADASRLQLPVWAAGLSPCAAGLGAAAAEPVSVRLGDRSVQVGDWLFGDQDGLVLVPSSIARLTIKAAAIKEKKERVFKARMLGGESLIDMMNVNGHLYNGESIRVDF